MANLINGLGGLAGFGENYLSGNDDDYISGIDITSIFGTKGLNFFGTNYTTLSINNNGNVTFGDRGLNEFTPFGLQTSQYPMIAAFFGDVDTRTTDVSVVNTVGGTSTGSNLVWYDLDSDSHKLTITWDDVGFFSKRTDKLNAFQIQLTGIDSNGNFDIDFRYESINWVTGNSSDGVDGLGGQVARAGYSTGDGISWVELPQSGNQDEMLGLPFAGNTGEAGVYHYSVRDGNVILPSVNDIFNATGYYSTFADLSKAAYHLAPTPNELTGLDNNFVKPYADDAFGRVQQDWHILTPNDLNLGGSNDLDLGGINSGNYRWMTSSGWTYTTNTSMTDLYDIVGINYGEASWKLEVDGIYHGNNAAAFAVRSDDAVVISFRGTNDNDADPTFLTNIPFAGSPDEQDWSEMDAHYGELLAFVRKIDYYVATNNIQKVYVTGHSLGGAMVLAYMLHHKAGAQTTADGSVINYEAVTFAAAGFNLLGSLDDRIVSIETDGDMVPDTGYHEGRIVAINSPTLSEDYHSMDLYMAAAHALDAELPDTSINTASSVHGFDLNKFNSANDGLIVTMAMKEFSDSNSDEYYSWQDKTAPQYVAMTGNNEINDLGVYASRYEDAAYFLGGEGNDVIGHIATNQAFGELGKLDLPAGAIMRGGINDDIYYVDHNFDEVIEKIDAGNDTVVSGISSYTLPDNVEILYLEDTAINGTGNKLVNYLKGNTTANVLNGDAGIDVMEGNAGNDIYYVDDINDEVVETTTLLTEIDLISSSVSYTLPTNVENLTLTGAATNGFGNELRNVLRGNLNANELIGGVGMDKLIGAAGKDILTGGVGSDKFIFNKVSDSATGEKRDVITDFMTETVDKPVDKIDLSEIDANTASNGNDVFLTFDIYATNATFKLTNALYFNSTTHILYGNNDTDAAADFSIFLSGVTTLNKTNFVL